MKHTLRGMGYYSSPTGGAVTPRRIHKDELVFELITAGAVYPLSGDVLHGAGWIFVHYPGESTIWRTEPDGQYECMTVTFDYPRVKKDHEWPSAFLWEDTTAALHFVHEMLYAFHHTHMDRVVLGELMGSQFRFRLAQFNSQKDRMEIPARVAAVMSFIDQHYAEPIGIDQMADHVAMSPSHLHAYFKKYAHRSPHQYLIRQRMREAQHALATSMAPIKAIARDVGYRNTETFCRAFRQHVGLTAATYRRKYMLYPK